MKVRFLIVRFGHDSEVLLTTPVIRCLKEQVEGAEIHYVVHRDHARLLEANPYLHKVHVLEKPMRNLIRTLKKEEFDYVIDLQRDAKAERIRYGLKLMSFDIPGLECRKWIFARLGINLLPARHWTELCLDTLKVFDVKNDNRGLDLHIPSHEEVSLKQLPPAFQHGYIAFFIGARYQTRRLPAGMIADVCNRIDYPVVLIGDEEDTRLGKEITDTNPAKVLNGCGRYSFWQSVFLVRQAKLVIAHDTGMMQVAAAFRQRIMSVWGNTVPGFGMAPYMPHEDSRMFQVEDLRCRPCSHNGYNTCPKKHFRCMYNQDVTKLAAHVMHLLEPV